MSWSTIKIDKADQTFSLAIRLRDKCCVSCGRSGFPNAQGFPVNGLQCSHYWSRRNESTRFDEQNCDALCVSCHQKWGGDYREEYKKFKIKQLGKKRYDLLEMRHNQYQKKDRKLSLLVAKQFLKMEQEKNYLTKKYVI